MKKDQREFLLDAATNRREGRERILYAASPKALIVTTVVLALTYFVIIAFGFPRGNVLLFSLLIVGEIFHLWQLFTYCYTVWETRHRAIFDPNFTPPVDIFITVAGEPLDVVEATASVKLDYPQYTVHILNDGYVTKKDNWREVERLAEHLGVNCITRKIPGGAKAGNINNALRETQNPFVAVFDVDHIPHPDFLKEVMGYFRDPRMAFVQTPQFYRNFGENSVTAGAWEQQELFFRSILNGKNRLNSVFMCGTNMVIRREALEGVGGMLEKSITEDFATSLFIHERGWKSLYVPKVLAEGLAPQDLSSYAKQQFRWARGSLDLIFLYNPIFRRGLTWAQKIQYLASASFYLSGPIVIMNALLPVVFFYTGLVPLKVATMFLALVFLPYMFLTVMVLSITTGFTLTFRAVSFAVATAGIQMRALWGSAFRRKAQFVITPKKAQSGNFLRLAIPHFGYLALVAGGILVALAREGATPSLFTNIAWAVFQIALFTPYMGAALPEAERRAAPAPAIKRAIAAERE